MDRNSGTDHSDSSNLGLSGISKSKRKRETKLKWELFRGPQRVRGATLYRASLAIKGISQIHALKLFLIIKLLIP